MLWIWVGFIAFVLAMLALDLGVFHRNAHEVSIKEAATWSVVWVMLALAFNGLVWWWQGETAALEFFTGYLIEKSLSVDNIFVFVLIFAVFAVPAKYQHRVLFWGILGALLMRGVMIALGAVLIERFHWIIYLFGAFLVFTGIKMFVLRHSEMDPGKNPVLRLVRRIFPVTDQYHDEKFFVRHAGKLLATPLFLVLVLVETTDLIFAVDSIPAIFAVTKDPFIVFTSNVFAILGLRSLYFLLAGAITKFYYLKPALAAILVFVGAKMLLVDVYKIPIGLSLAVIGGLLGVAILASWWRLRRSAILQG
ncbi:MAG TPA: TerC family protein [Thermoanaerobaculia bacterium]|nr:TerC family protein [Thermoanaerobaculia bacterium]